MDNVETGPLLNKNNPGVLDRSQTKKKDESFSLMQAGLLGIRVEEKKQKEQADKNLAGLFGFAEKMGSYNSTDFGKSQSIDISESNYQDDQELQRIIDSYQKKEEINTIILNRNTKITDEAFKIMASIKDPKFRPQVLNFEHCLNITDEAIKTLTDPANECFTSLERLNISMCDDITDAGLKMIASTKNFSKLKKFKMDKMYSMTSEGLTAILFSENFVSLEKLSLARNASIDDSCIEILINQKSILNKLKKINLNECTTLTPEGISKLINSKAVSEITSMKLLGVKATRSVDKALATSPYLNNLTSLELSTSGEIKEFTRSQTFKHIHSLVCIRTELTQVEFDAIMKKRKSVVTKKKVFISDSKNIDLLGKTGIFENAENLAISGLNQKGVFRVIFSKLEENDPYKVPDDITKQSSGIQEKKGEAVEGSEPQSSPLRVLQIASAPKIEKESLDYLNNFLSTQPFKLLSTIRFYDVGITDMTLYYLGRADLGLLKELTLEKCVKVTEIGIKNIALSWNVKPLDRLTLKDWRISEHALKFIATSKNFDNLTYLELINIQINTNGVRNVLSAVSSLPKLKHVSLEKNSTLTDECANQIVVSKGRIKNLQTLKLDTFNKIDFKNWEKLKTVKCLDIDLKGYEYNNDVYEINKATKDKEILFRAFSFFKKNDFHANPKFQELTIHSDEVLNIEDVKQILIQPELIHLKSLAVIGFGKADKFFHLLKELPSLQTLSSLKLQRCELETDDQRSQLNAAKEFFTNCKYLTTINIEECKGVTDEIIEVIVSCVEKLINIEFATIDIKDKSVEFIANSPKSKGLKHLQLLDCDNLTDRATEIIVKSEHLTKLTVLNMSECNGLKMDSIHNLLSGRKFNRLVELRCNLPLIDLCPPPGSRDKPFLDSFINSQMPNLLRIKLKFNEIEKDQLKTAIKFQIGEKSNNAVYCRKKHLKDLLLNKLLKDKNLHLIDNEIIELLLQNDQLRAVCNIPQRLNPSEKISNKAVKMILDYKDNDQFDLEMNKLVEFWYPIVQSDNLIQISSNPKLREELAQADLKKMKLNQDDKKKFAQSIGNIKELTNFLKKNTEALDDEMFKGLLANPLFVQVKFIDFKKIKVSPAVISKIFELKESEIDFPKYVEFSGLDKKDVDGDIIVNAFVNGKFSKDISEAPMPSDFKKLNSEHTFKIMKSSYANSLTEFHLTGNAISADVIKLLGKEECELKSLKKIKFSHNDTNVISKYGDWYFQKQNFKQIEELYLENLSLDEDFYQKCFGNEKGSIKVLSFRNIVNTSSDDNLIIALLLSKVFKTLEHLVVYRMKPIRETFLSQITALDLVNLKRLEVGKLSKYLNHELVLEAVSSIKFYSTLECLVVKNMQLGDQFMSRLAKSDFLRSPPLKEVRLEDIAINQAQLEIFLASKVAANLVTLDVKSKHFDKGWVETILQNPLPNLENLSYGNTDETLSKALNLDKPTIDIIHSPKFVNLNIETFVERNPQIITDNVLVNGICESKDRLGKIEKLNLRNCNLKPESVAKFIEKIDDVQLASKKFNYKEFMERHKDCHFLDDSVYEKIEAILGDEENKGENSDKFFELKDKFVMRSRLRKLIRSNRVKQSHVNHFFSVYPDFVDDELIDTFVKYREAVNPLQQAKLSERIILRLNSSHINVKRRGIENILCSYIDEFTPQYDWVLLEERFRNLLTVDGLRVIAEAKYDFYLEYVVDFTFGKNYYLSTVGNQYLLREEVEGFLRSKSILDKDFNDLDYGEKCAYRDVKSFIEDLIDKRVDWERIDLDEEVADLYLKILENANYVKHIDLEDKNLGDRFVKELCKIICKRSLESGKCFIETINLKNNPRITLVGYKYLYATLYGNNTIKDVEVEVDDEYKLEFNNMVNFGIKYMINQQLREYLDKCLVRKEYKIYDNLCIPVSLYACCCMPVAYYHYNEDSINKKVKNSSCVKCAESLIPKKKEKHVDINVDAVSQSLSSRQKRQKQRQKVVKPAEIQGKNGQKIASTYFVFSQNIAKLNIIFKKSYWTILFFIYFISFYGVSIVPPILTIDQCEPATPWISHGIYIAFAIFAFVLEYWLYYIMTITINDPDIIKLNFGGITSVLSSQVNKFSFYSNNIFIIQLYNCNYEVLAYISIGFAAFFALTHVYYLVKIFKNAFVKWIFNRPEAYHTTKYINKHGKYCFHLEFGAISKVLERFASSTSVKIRGFYYPQVIIGALSKFVIGDLPQVIIKLYYIITNPSSANSLILLSLISNALKLSKSFFAALEAKPTVVEPQQIRNLANGVEQRNKPYKEIQECYDQAFLSNNKDEDEVEDGTKYESTNSKIEMTNPKMISAKPTMISPNPSSFKKETAK